MSTYLQSITSYYEYLLINGYFLGPALCSTGPKDLNLINFIALPDPGADLKANFIAFFGA